MEECCEKQRKKGCPECDWNIYDEYMGVRYDIENGKAKIFPSDSGKGKYPIIQNSRPVWWGIKGRRYISVRGVIWSLKSMFPVLGYQNMRVNQVTQEAMIFETTIKT
jgi:hypothetical protein